MKYSKRQLKGLIASVDKWVLKYEGKCAVYGIDGCPLCQLYYIKDCRYCPVKKDTGQMCCGNTPYINLASNNLFDGSWWKRYATKADKLKELRYLISLLPKANQKKYKKYMKVKK